MPTAQIDYIQRSGTGWFREPTPYRGFVMAVAWDTTGTYLLYMDLGSGLRITKRLANGTYTGAGRWRRRPRSTVPSPKVT